MHPANAVGVWTLDWVWGLAIITTSVMVHAAGLALIAIALTRLFGRAIDRSERGVGFIVTFATVIGFAALLLAILHGIEAMLWAVIYVALGAISDFSEAIYFSLAMMSTSGADVTMLKPHWKLMGAFEAVVGALLFGMSTALLFHVLQRIGPITTRDLAGHSERDRIRKPLPTET
jgi:hypothetical protein